MGINSGTGMVIGAIAGIVIVPLLGARHRSRWSLAL